MEPTLEGVALRRRSSKPPCRECGKRSMSQSLCWPHLKQLRLINGDLCSVGGCDQARFGREYCTRHQAAFSARGRAKALRRRAPGPRRQFKVPPDLRLAIYERDGWTCQLCGDPVDPDLPSTDRWSATLDHIECQSWVLVPDHSPRNLRLAHRVCNARRGDRAA